MSESPLNRPADELSRPWIWVGATLAAGAVTAWGVWLTATTTWPMLLRGEVAPRTLWGILALVAGFLGPVIPVLLALSRRRFLRMSRRWQWTALVVIPAIYFLLLMRLITAAEHFGSTPIVPILYPLPLTVRVESCTSLTFPPPPLTGSPAAHLVGSGSRFGDDKTTTFENSFGVDTIYYLVTGTMTRTGPNAVEIDAKLELHERFRFRVEGLANAEVEVVTPDGRRVSESLVFEPGKYTLVIRGRPKGK